MFKQGFIPCGVCEWIRVPFVIIYPGPEGGKPGAQKPVTCITGSIDLGGGHRYLKTDVPTSCF